MKKIALTLALLTTVSCAFGQGKVQLLNNPTSLATLTTDPGYIAREDLGKAGQPIGNENPLSGVTLRAGLYAGTDSYPLYLYSSTLMNKTTAGSAGTYGPLNIVLNDPDGSGPAVAIPGIANGTPIGAGTPWFQIKFWDSRFASYEAAWTTMLSSGVGYYFGQTTLFQANPSNGLFYTPLVIQGSANSTWVNGPITIRWILIPEPSAFALAGLGAVALMVFRHRKEN